MAKTTIPDLDDIFADEEPITTTKIRLFNRDWTIVCDLNPVALSSLVGGEPGGIITFLDSIIDPTERGDFKKAISSVRGLNSEKLGALLERLIEVISERPTTPPSGSSPGGSNRSTRRSSGASTS